MKTWFNNTDNTQEGRKAIHSQNLRNQDEKHSELAKMNCNESWISLAIPKEKLQWLTSSTRTHGFLAVNVPLKKSLHYEYR